MRPSQFGIDRYLRAEAKQALPLVPISLMKRASQRGASERSEASHGNGPPSRRRRFGEVSPELSRRRKRAGEAARERACRAVRGAKPLEGGKRERAQRSEPRER